jgi:hypothetical protein
MLNRYESQTGNHSRFQWHRNYRKCLVYITTKLRETGKQNREPEMLIYNLRLIAIKRRNEKRRKERNHW